MIFQVDALPPALICSRSANFEPRFSTMPRILIADDQPDVLEALRLLLKSEGFQIDAEQSPAAALRALESNDYDVVLIDLNYARDTTSGQEGLELLKRIQAVDSA